MSEKFLSSLQHSKQSYLAASSIVNYGVCKKKSGANFQLFDVSISTVLGYQVD